MTKETLFYKRLITLVNQTGKSVNQIERELGYSRNALHNYKSGVEPSGIRLIEISNYLGVTPEYLLGTVNQSHSQSLKSFFKQLNTKQKCEMIILCKEWLEH